MTRLCNFRNALNLLICVCCRCFCLIERYGVNVYSFSGRLLASPKWGSMRLDTLAKDSISLGPDVLAVIDQNDSKSILYYITIYFTHVSWTVIFFSAIHIFDLPTGIAVRSSSDHSSTTVTHVMLVSKICLNQSGPPNQRQLAIVDFNKDLYVLSPKESKTKFNKLGILYMFLIIY